MGFWVAVAITLAVFGSILWVKPSPRDKAITAFRGKALECGLKVRLLDQKLGAALFPWVDNYRLYTMYEAPLPIHAKLNSPKARVIRLSFNEEVHELDRVDELRDELERRDVLCDVPQTVNSIVISAGGIGVLWEENLKEGVEQVEHIKRLLERCIQNAELWQ